MSPVRDAVAEAARTLYGSRHARRTRKDALRHRSVADGVAALTAAGCSTTSTEAPIFIFSAGWRSGSTLLQRLLMSGGDALLWGEPHDRACLLQRLAETVRPFSADWPPPSPPWEAAPLSAMPKEWIANLYPPVDALQTAYRALIEQLFKQPALQRGASRWGFKEVRLGADEARLLRWLYPQARLLFLYRSPYAAYRSYKAFQSARGWYVRWPEQHAFTPWAFGRHWQRLAGEFVAEAKRLDALLIPYESLVSGALKVEDIAAYCGFALDASVLQRRVGSGCAETADNLTLLERQLIRRATAPLAARLGYGPDGDQAPGTPAVRTFATATAEGCEG